jgi:hypothetical protein
MKKSFIDALDDYFAKELKQARSNEAAYDAATQRFEEDHGFTVPYSYGSFRRKKERKKKTRG